MIEIGRVGNAYSYKHALSSLSDNFGDNIMFTDITPKTLSNYEYKLQLKELKINSIAAYMRAIRAIYNKAIKQEVTDKANYPFDRYTIKHETTKKRAISVDDLRKIYKMQLDEHSIAWHCRNYFVLIFCLIGINFTDLSTLTSKNLVNGRIQYRRKKTKKLYNIKLTPIANEIIEFYKDSHSKYLLPILPENKLSIELQKKVIADKLKQCNKQLKKIGCLLGLPNPLTTYVSRHSWATTAKSIGISHEVIAECLGHSYGNRITGIYLDDFDKNHLDSANNQVIQHIFG